MRTAIYAFCFVISSALAVELACSANESAGGGGNGAGASGGKGGTGGKATGGTGGVGASGGTGASGGSLVDVNVNDTGDPDAACSTYTQKASNAVDIIWLVDNSCSMTDEIDKIRTNINGSFVPTIDKSIIDWQVIMVSARGTNEQKVCVDPPLATASCGNNPPKFTHLDCEVDSSNSLYAAAYSYLGGGFPPLLCNLAGGPWSKLARYDATKIFVEVTDDEADFFGWNADGFDNWLLTQAQPPGMFGTAQKRKYIFHSIIGADPVDPTKTCNSATIDGGVSDAGGDASAGNAAVDPGLEYQKLSKLTGGIIRSICEPDWSDIFNTIANGIVEKLSCEFTPPTPGDGGSIDPDKVNVKFTPSSGTPTDILQDNNKPCDAGADGWQWDSTKTKIILCGQTCDTVKGDVNGKIEVVIGCKTNTVPPPT